MERREKRIEIQFSINSCFFLHLSFFYCVTPVHCAQIDIWIALPANKPSHQLSTNSQCSGTGTRFIPFSSHSYVFFWLFEKLFAFFPIWPIRDPDHWTFSVIYLQLVVKKLSKWPNNSLKLLILAILTLTRKFTLYPIRFGICSYILTSLPISNNHSEDVKNETEIFYSFSCRSLFLLDSWIQ